jgi:Na+/proline symporter
MIASKLKQHAPHCHTYLEIIRARWGAAAHITFLFFGLATNIIVSTMLILGGSATVTDLTGMSTVAACFLIPLGVSIYVLTGGMRATLIADYSHTLVLYCILISFALIAYGSSSLIGSPARMWELLHQASLEKPVSGNAEGSYLTMRSKSGLIFGVLNIVGNFVCLSSSCGEEMADLNRVPFSTTKPTGSEPSLLDLRLVPKLSSSVESLGSVSPWVSRLRSV